MAQAPDWLSELPLKPGPPWLSMGVRPLDLDEWLVVDDDFAAQLELKARLLAERHDEVFAARPGTEAAGAELLERIQAWLTTHVPTEGSAPAAEPVPSRGDIGRPDGTGSPAPAPGALLHPLDRAGRLVQEDLCLLAPEDGRHVLVAASLCFPSHWRLADKMGLPVAAIHGPVPHYAPELEARVDTFFERLRPGRPVVRRNLSIHAHDDLFRPEPHESPDSFAPDLSGLDQVWLRSERQTLLRLDGTGTVVFTIKTQQCPVGVLAQRPDVASALAAKLRALEPELVASGETVPFPSWLIGWLLDPR